MNPKIFLPNGTTITGKLNQIGCVITYKGIKPQGLNSGPIDAYFGKIAWDDFLENCEKVLAKSN